MHQEPLLMLCNESGQSLIDSVCHYKTRGSLRSKLNLLEYGIDQRLLAFSSKLSFLGCLSLLFFLSLLKVLLQPAVNYHPTPLTTPVGFSLRLLNLWSFVKFYSGWYVLCGLCVLLLWAHILQYCTYTAWVSCGLSVCVWVCARPTYDTHIIHTYVYQQMKSVKTYWIYY